MSKRRVRGPPSVSLFQCDFIVWASCYNPLLGRTWSRGKCSAAIRLSSPEPSGHMLHGEVDASDIRGQHARRLVRLHHTQTSCRRGRTPFVWAGAETDTGAEAIKPDTSCSGEGHSRRVAAGVGDENAEFRSVLQLLRNCSIGDPPRAPHFCCRQMNWWVVRWVQLGVSIWDVVHSHSMDRWALTKADVQASPVATGGFWGLSPPKQSSKPPKLKYETL